MISPVNDYLGDLTVLFYINDYVGTEGGVVENVV